MKISYIGVKSLTSGGIEKYTIEIGSRLVQKGHNITVYIIKNDDYKPTFYKGMKIVPVPAFKTKSLEKISSSLIASLKCCLMDSPDIVHIHAFGPGMLSIIPRAMNKRVVVQGHGIEWKRSRWNNVGKWVLKVTEFPSVKFPNKVTVVSQVQQKYLKKKYNIDSTYIPGGVNPPHIKKPDLIKQYGLNGNDYILFSARLVKEKGAHYLINAYNNIKTKMKLVIAGDAPYEDEYKAELKSLSKDNKNIIFTGFARGRLLAELLSNCYIYVLPSEIEGLSISLLEAMSYGNCCLVSDIQENLEALNGYGYSFKRSNVDDLTNKLETLIGNGSYVNKVKDMARDHVLRNYSWDMIASQMEALYLDLLKE
jgi:glycosyltransferase involved in cell wall biosynthesis